MTREMTPEQRERHLEKRRKKEKQRRDNETPEQRERANARRRERYRKRIASETPEEKLSG